LEIKALYRIWAEFNNLGDFILSLENEDQPSKKIQTYIENQLVPKLAEIEFVKREP
jgi:hypothetical protein